MKFVIEGDGTYNSTIDEWIDRNLSNIDYAVKQLILNENSLSEVLTSVRRIEAEMSELKEILGKKEDEDEIPNDVIDNIKKIGIRR